MTEKRLSNQVGGKLLKTKILPFELPLTASMWVPFVKPF
jgi:hypothetical protein